MYFKKGRWVSIWYKIQEILEENPTKSFNYLIFCFLAEI